MRTVYYTDRLILRVLKGRDAKLVCDYYQRNEAFLREWEPQRTLIFLPDADNGVISQRNTA
jgi:RimJ/RimL family protein N-acetyltransferase